MKYIDTHTHYDHKRYKSNYRESVLDHIDNNDEIAYVINATIGQQSMMTMRTKLTPYKKVLFTVGKHPNSAARDSFGNSNDKKEIEAMLNDDRTVAIGETGIDTFRTIDKEGINNQIKWFYYFIDLSAKSKKPMILHVRGKKAYRKAVQILTKEKDKQLSGVFHCFCESYRTYKRCAKCGDFYFGIGGALTLDRKNSKRLRKAVKKMPLERIVLETDCPFLKPSSYGEKMNDSLSIPMIIEKIAELKGLSVDIVAETTYNNAMNLFNLKD